MCKFYKLKFLGEERQYNDYGCKTFFSLFHLQFSLYKQISPLQTLLVIFGFLNSCCEMSFMFY